MKTSKCNFGAEFLCVTGQNNEQMSSLIYECELCSESFPIWIETKLVNERKFD